MSFFKRFLRSAMIAPFLIATARAITLDGSTTTWTPGSLANSYDIDPAQPGNDITVTVSGDTAQLQPEVVSPFPLTPAITTNFQGGQANSFTFTYGSGSGAVADPTYQHVGIDNITFTRVPEMNPVWSAVGSCLLAAVLILRHSAKFRK